VSTHIEDVDLLVVGSGKAGKTLAMDRAKAGQRVAMVERGMIGGTCINVACIPTKALVAAARALRTTRRAAEFGIRVGEPEVDVALLRAHKQGVIEWSPYRARLGPAGRAQPRRHRALSNI
jgi:pyruvate/2-oxoglutarate dehydrogenase complex dihydrolipoamide dehydrogenase (E3) component